ncbi:MAG: hypothetical protein ACREEB_13455 [Caulobacteraceae bacterium]
MQAWAPAIAATWLAVASPATAGPASPEARILAGESASAVLGQWCQMHGLPPLAARHATGGSKPAPRTVLRALSMRPGERVAYRRVTLACGSVALSRADNW